MTFGSKMLPLLALLLLTCSCAHLEIARASIESSARVAAFASRLEQWFACRRANQLEAHNSLSQQELAGSSGGGGNQSARLAARCAAHFDGHLCWPESQAGERVKLACPCLNWSLVSQQRPAAQSPEVRSVINSPSLATATSLTPPPPPAAIDNQMTPPTTSSATNATPLLVSVAGDAANSGALISSQQREAPKFAYRTCGSPLERAPPTESDKNGGASIIRSPPPSPSSQLASWLTNEADYSQCTGSHVEPLSSLWPSSSSSAAAHDFDPTDRWIKLDQVEDKRLFERLQEELDRIEGAIDPYADPELLQQWTLCIGNIMLDAANSNDSAQSGDPWCPIIFDGWRCWPSTRASEVAYVSCPSNQPGFSAERKAHKICTSDGTWYKHPMTNRYWSNYTTCVDTVDLAFRTKILNLYVIGNLISLVALSASLIIFISFKSLNCTRVTIHKNLFLSFITNNLMWIIWYTCVVNDANLLQSNPIGCQLWHILLHYFLVSNYFWMFCEGLYLHTLLVVAFVSENKILKWFYLLGWLTPIPITVAYAYNRSYDEYYTNFCWMEESPYNLILMAPIGISLLLNLVFLINIVRVLVTKLRANNSPDTHQTRKAVRATLILIPLLGLHYMLTPFRPEAKSEWEVIYEIVAAVCTSFQGLCVAMLFCFCNAEVMAVIKKKLKDSFNLQHHNRNRNRNHSHNGTGNFYSNQPMRSRSNTLLEAAVAATGPTVANSSGRFNSIAAPGTGFDLRQAPLSKSQAPLKLNGSNTSQHANQSRSNGSNSSSLLTTVTASPVYSNDSNTVNISSAANGSNGETTPTIANSVA